MNFFERQDATRRSSRRLVILFALAVIAVIAAVDLVVFVVLSRLEAHQGGLDDGAAALPLGAWMSTHPGTMLLTTLIVGGVISLASLYKTMVLSGGGGVVARSLGGVRVSADTTDPEQRRLLNVVEEMSIASGVPMPEVYLLEHENGINAFAAGHNPSNAAIGVTRGAITRLNRGELQGVIAHEFSHILNGDMRLNVRLIGLLFGLLVIALIGRTIMRTGAFSRGGKKGGSAAALMLTAAAVLVIGYIGLFFGRLIQAAVSRHRESLADASAVQFTRDPIGLRGALLKIAALSSGSKIGNPEVEEVAHMLFAPGMSRVFATHPSLPERLRAIDPTLDERGFEAARAQMAAALAAQTGEHDRAAKETSAQRLDALITFPTAPVSVSALVGNPGTEHMVLARQIRKSLPDAVTAAGRHPRSARALLLALALDANGDARERQKRFIAQQLGSEVAAGVVALESSVDALAHDQRMPALLRASPALRQLSREERTALMSCLNAMLHREGRVSLRSYVLRKLAQVHLRDDLEPAARHRQYPLSAVRDDVHVLLCVLAQHGHSDEAESRRAYETGMHHLYPRERPPYAVADNWPARLDVALSRLDQLLPAGKEQLVEAMVITVSHDLQLTVGESELLRAVCASLHCPLPPLVSPAFPAA